RSCSTRSTSRGTSTIIRATTATSTRTTTPKPRSSPRLGPASGCLAVALAWTLFAFGGLPTWTLAPAAGALALAAVCIRPHIPHSIELVLAGLVLTQVVLGGVELVLVA